MTSNDIPWPERVRVLGIWLVVVLLATMILVARLPLAGQVQLAEGDVAPADIIATRQVTYVSDILTKQRRDLAANAVPEVYDPPQARIGRQQLNLLNLVLDFIGSVRADSYADLPAKTAQIKAIPSLNLAPEVITRTLTLPNPAWDRVAAETQVVLERAMREEIRENGLADERRKIPARVRLDFSDEDVAIVSAIVEDLLAPNSFYNAERTEQQRQQARDRVEPATTSIERNEIILRAGDIVSALDLEALERSGLRQPTWSWMAVAGTLAFVWVLGLVLLYYLWHAEPQFWLRRAEPPMLALVVLVFLAFAKLAIPSQTLLPYLFPYAALAMVLSLLINQRVALIVAGLFVLVIGWLTEGNLALMVYAFAPTLVGTLKLRRGERLASFATTAGYMVAVNLAVVFAFILSDGQVDLRGIAERAVAAMINGVVTVTVTLVGVYLVGLVFGVVTPLQLIELSRPTHPVLRQLLLKAPGTYHHTLIVSNMAERAAEAIGADSLLTRVGAYYHDVGKTIRPYFFIENRTEGADPHARLDPHTSAQVIISHVTDGIGLAQKHRLPQRLADFIPEHHGTLLVSYFYHQAVRQAGSQDAVDKAAFRYPGPKPQSRETALCMLADGAEATVRSKRPTSLEEIEQIVSESIQSRIVSGQLDECPLTMDDLREIRRAFVDVLRGLHHPRISYPAEATQAEPSPEQSVGDETPRPTRAASRTTREERRAPTNRDSGASRAV
jgi:putative nucleotidyltransferase with HDIG domain